MDHDRLSLAGKGHNLQGDIGKPNRSCWWLWVPWEQQESQRVLVCTAQRCQRGGTSQQGLVPPAPAATPVGLVPLFASLPPLPDGLIRAAAGQRASSSHVLNHSPPTVIFANPGEIFNWLLRGP